MRGGRSRGIAGCAGPGPAGAAGVSARASRLPVSSAGASSGPWRSRPELRGCLGRRAALSTQHRVRRPPARRRDCAPGGRALRLMSEVGARGLQVPRARVVPFSARPPTYAAAVERYLTAAQAEARQRSKEKKTPAAGSGNNGTAVSGSDLMPLTNDRMREFCENPGDNHVSPGRHSQKSSRNRRVVRGTSERLPPWISRPIRQHWR